MELKVYMKIRIEEFYVKFIIFLDSFKILDKAGKNNINI